MLESALVYRPIIPSCPKCKRGIPDGEGHTFCTAIGEWGDDAETEEHGGWCKFFREKKYKRKKRKKKRIPERYMCIAPACDGECEGCDYVTADELDHVRARRLPCPFTGERCNQTQSVFCENCSRYLQVMRIRTGMFWLFKKPKRKKVKHG